MSLYYLGFHAVKLNVCSSENMLRVIFFFINFFISNIFLGRNSHAFYVYSRDGDEVISCMLRDMKLADKAFHLSEG